MAHHMLVTVWARALALAMHDPLPLIVERSQVQVGAPAPGSLPLAWKTHPHADVAGVTSVSKLL